MLSLLKYIILIPEEIRCSIGFKVLQIVFAIYFIIALTVTIFHISVEYRTSFDKLNLKLRIFSQTSAPILAEALYQFDQSTLQSAVKGFLTNPEIVGVDVISEDYHDFRLKAGFIRTSIGNIFYDDLGTNKKNYLHTELLSYSNNVIYHKPLAGLNLKLGNVTLYSSRAVVMESLRLSLMFIIINAIIKTIAIWYLFLFGITKYITKPLGKFTNQVEKVTLNNLHAIHVVGFNKNPTELNKLENSFNIMINTLKNSINAKELYEKYLKDISNSMPSALIGIDINFNITLLNKEAALLFYLDEEPTIGSNLFDKIPMMKDYEQLIDDTFRTNTMQSKDKIKCYIHDKKYYFNILAFPLGLNKSGIIIRLDNINEKIKLESFLMQSEKLTSLATLAAGMAHELNNPLASIMQCSQNIERRVNYSLSANQEIASALNIDINKVHEYLEKRGIFTFIEGIKKSSDRAAYIIKSITNFTSKSFSERVEISPNDAIEHTIEAIATEPEIKELIKDLGDFITFQRDDRIKNYLCSSQDLHHIVMTLVKNAVDAIVMDPGKNNKTPSIELLTSALTDGFLIQVRDNGIGIDEKHINKIFDPFFTTKAVGKGVGLGLTSLLFLVNEKYNGKIWVDSKLNQGTIFNIELPYSY